MITIQSFGFKYGKPQANIIMDVSYFKNPWRSEEIRDENDFDKRREMIINFMLKQDGVKDFVHKVCEVLRIYELCFPNENIQIAFCCSAGEYRSPVIAELVYRKLKSWEINSTLAVNINSKIGYKIRDEQ